MNTETYTAQATSPQVFVQPHGDNSVASVAPPAETLDERDREIFDAHPEVSVYVRAFHTRDDRHGLLTANLSDSFGATVVCRSGFILSKFWRRDARLSGKPVDVAIRAARTVARNFPEAGLMGGPLGFLAVSPCVEALC